MTTATLPAAGGKTAFYTSIVKRDTLDDGSVRITGLVSDETVDSQGERILYETAKRAFEGWRELNVREMHKEEVVGGVDEIIFDDENRTISVIATIDNDGAPRTVAKIKKGRLKGFSLAGSVPAGGRRLVRDLDGRAVVECTQLDLDEVSVVDSPSNFNSHFTIMKRAGNELVPGGRESPDDDPEDSAGGTVAKVLREGSSDEVVEENIGRLVDEGKPREQAVAIALEKAGRVRQGTVKESRMPDPKKFIQMLAELGAMFEAEYGEGAGAAAPMAAAASPIAEGAAKTDDDKDPEGAPSGIAKGATAPAVEPAAATTPEPTPATPAATPAAAVEPTPDFSAVLAKSVGAMQTALEAKIDTAVGALSSRIESIESQTRPPKGALHTNVPTTAAKSRPMTVLEEIRAKAEAAVPETPELTPEGRSTLVALEAIRQSRAASS